MKIDLAVYTAQEGYSWQPGTVLTSEQLRSYKTCIGKFPSPDDPAFPIGGVFLKDDRLVCYRYHVARKIDFRGRDALYCVLGVLPKAEAEHLDPLALLALPQFAAPMIPFPTVAELPPAPPEKVPEWLKGLGEDTLDVRITGMAEKPDFAVVRNAPPKPAPVDAPAPARVSSDDAGHAVAASKSAGPEPGKTPPGARPYASDGNLVQVLIPTLRKVLRRRSLLLAVLCSAALLFLALAIALLLLFSSFSTTRRGGSGSVTENVPATNSLATAETQTADPVTNVVEVVSKPDNSAEVAP